MTTKVVLHVGTPKTGTSMIQDLLTRNAEELRKHGVLVPTHRLDHPHRASMDLLGGDGIEPTRADARPVDAEATEEPAASEEPNEAGVPAADYAGSWDALVRRVRDFDGTVIISEEKLAIASSEAVARAMRSFDGCDVEVVVSVRDLGRQIPSEWQEMIKHRFDLSYRQFLRQLKSPERRSLAARTFWASQDWQAVAERWGASLPDAKVHLVTVPPAGDSHRLPERMLAAFGLDPAWLPIAPERTNDRLGSVEAKVIRTINRRNPRETYPEHYHAEFIRQGLVPSLMRERPEVSRITLPPREHEWAVELTGDWVNAASKHDYRIHGDLDDLQVRPVEDWANPDNVRPRDELAVAYDVIDRLLAEQVAEREGNVDRFHQIARAYVRQNASRFRVARWALRTKSRFGTRHRK